MAHSKPTKYAQKACCVGYWTLVAKIWTLAMNFGLYHENTGRYVQELQIKVQK